MLSIRDLIETDREWRDATLRAGWGSTQVARLGELVDAAELPGFVAEQDGERVGLATFAERADGLEIVTLQALIEGVGVGRALMQRLRDHAIESGVVRLWLTTTNDNIAALAFYQRCGMDLVSLIVDGVELSRRVKPSIPATGVAGIPLRHELEFELRFR